MIIAYNIRGTDGEKITTEQIISDFEKETEPCKFDSVQFGAGGGT